MKEEKIHELLSTVPISTLFVDEQGQELKEVTKIKNELVRIGLSKEVVDSILDTDVVERKVSEVIAKEIENTLTRKEERLLKPLSTDTILMFSRENMGIIVTELQKNNIPKAELLTEEKQKEILIKMEVVAPQIEEEVNKVIPVLQEKLEGSNRKGQFEKIKTRVEKITKVTQFLYSRSSTFLLITIIAFCIGMIFLLCHSTYRYLKFFGLTCFLNGVFFLGCVFVLARIKKQLPDLPTIVQEFLIHFLDCLEHSFQNLVIMYFVLFFFFIGMNFLIRKILDGRVEKKLANI